MDVKPYREKYRTENISPHYSGWLHALFIFGGGGSVVLWLASTLDQVSAWEWLTVPLTFVYANLAEYAGHRWPMHRPFAGLRQVFQRHAGQHHRFFVHSAMEYESTRDFKAVLFPPLLIVFFFGLFLIPLWFVMAALLSPNVASLFAMTGIAYYLNYELLHFAYHHPRLRQVPGIRRLNALHTTHHDQSLMTRYNFNITYPIGDWLFGTLYRQPDS